MVDCGCLDSLCKLFGPADRCCGDLVPMVVSHGILRRCRRAEAGCGGVAAGTNVTECGSVADDAEPGHFSVDANMAVPKAVANVANISEREAVAKKVEDGVAANEAWRHSR